MWHVGNHWGLVWSCHGTSVRWWSLEQLFVTHLILFVFNPNVLPRRHGVKGRAQAPVLFPGAIVTRLGRLDRLHVAEDEALLDIDHLDLALDHRNSDRRGGALTLDVVQG